jgi:hypothetical protein
MNSLIYVCAACFPSFLALTFRFTASQNAIFLFFRLFCFFPPRGKLFFFVCVLLTKISLTGHDRAICIINNQRTRQRDHPFWSLPSPESAEKCFTPINLGASIIWFIHLLKASRSRSQLSKLKRILMEFKVIGGIPREQRRVIYADQRAHHLFMTWRLPGHVMMSQESRFFFADGTAPQNRNCGQMESRCEAMGWKSVPNMTRQFGSCV